MTVGSSDTEAAAPHAAAAEEIEVSQVHCFAKPWEMAPPGVAIVVFPAHVILTSF